MAINITSDYVDAAGYRRVVIQSSAGDSMMLKFPPGMSQEDMKASAQVTIDAEKQRRQDVAARQAQLDQITNGVGLYQQGRLNTTQQTTLLAALAAEWKGA